MSTLRTQHWLYSDTPPVCTAALKTHPEDFVVTEDLGYSFSGDGEHQFLWVEKKPVSYTHLTLPTIYSV